MVCVLKANGNETFCIELWCFGYCVCCGLDGPAEPMVRCEISVAQRWRQCPQKEREKKIDAQKYGNNKLSEWMLNAYFSFVFRPFNDVFNDWPAQQRTHWIIFSNLSQSTTYTHTIYAILNNSLVVAAAATKPWIFLALTVASDSEPSLYLRNRESERKNTPQQIICI